MRASIAAASIIVLALPARPPLVAAPRIPFPYEATVDADDAVARSGPGRQYYPTARLPRGTRVTVHRHDPGGWHMISPPPGSFSWIPARYVRLQASDLGVVTANDVAVRVGSSESDARDVFQARLAEGDEVRILAEKAVPSEREPGETELWYQIEPPRGEWRWIQGQHLSPPPRPAGDAARGGALPAQPGAGPAPAVAWPEEGLQQRGDADGSARLYQELPGDEAPIQQRPLARHSLPPRQPPSASPSPRRDAQFERQLRQLEQLDARLQAILDQDPLDWNFAQLEDDYRALRGGASSQTTRAMIDSRLARIEQFKSIQARRREVGKIMQATSLREAELAERQRQHEARLAQLRQARFDAAGIVERAALAGAGAPRFALLAPNGRVLAYLLPAPGVDLGPWLRRAAGVAGPRSYDPRLKADVITVTAIAPARLAP